jgi:hypothetical protein
MFSIKQDIEICKPYLSSSSFSPASISAANTSQVLFALLLYKGSRAGSVAAIVPSECVAREEEEILFVRVDVSNKTSSSKLVCFTLDHDAVPRPAAQQLGHIKGDIERG